MKVANEARNNQRRRFLSYRSAQRDIV
jgi:hypothetical protein